MRAETLHNQAAPGTSGAEAPSAGPAGAAAKPRELPVSLPATGNGPPGAADQEKTGLGNYFIANYPPFSFWKKEWIGAAIEALHRPPRPDVPLGLYIHIPFCRKRCKFCYFRVYTDKNARDIETYLEALVREVELLRSTPCVGDRQVDYVYFGGGTPSYLSAAQLDRLLSRLRHVFPWDHAREITFECEPGTLQKHKLETLRHHGITRLSLGVENFKPEILEFNGRAHSEEEIYRAYAWARELGFPQINIDLIAGMVGEDWDNWRRCVAQTIALAPDCVTIYQMELPYNTVFSQQLRQLGQTDSPSAAEPSGAVSGPAAGAGRLTMRDETTQRLLEIADWPTKRAWVRYAFAELEKAGYTVTSATTAVKNPATTRFIYREALWHGADMFGTGVASFGHINGVHVQNVDTWEQYLSMLQAGQWPFGRAFPTTPRDRLIREVVLLLKTGRLDVAYFRHKYGVDILQEFHTPLEQLCRQGYLQISDQYVTCTREGLIQIDRLLPLFFDPQFISSRYT
ncbi:MAG: coproporphyrinogen III oxidase family protein [Gemmataceae bacterium]|nr:coproporphyrinogen III oxidase family protein [Gemmataceae bacterium]MCS7270777.1 coproporphyrinogen III oxidase family protein [Gemmataceae bacterium]MDW8244409.1 coproporphyrinogen-III oxidase family protein [Thermogemmata sp.]